MFYKLKNVTKKDKEYVEFLKKSLGNETIVTIYELNKNTRIVFTDNGIDKHASISNPIRDVLENEIQFIAEKIMKLTDEIISMQKSTNGIIHLYLTSKKIVSTQ